jgi:hypothetical protein
MKRNCNECKALDTVFSPRCNLGFKIQGAKEIYGLYVSWKPLEECPKPKTYADYCKLHNLRSQEKTR